MQYHVYWNKGFGDIVNVDHLTDNTLFYDIVAEEESSIPLFLYLMIFKKFQKTDGAKFFETTTQHIAHPVQVVSKIRLNEIIWFFQMVVSDKNSAFLCYV